MKRLAVLDKRLALLDRRPAGASLLPYGLDGDRPSLEALLGASPYRGYTYAYPHKTAYRKLPSTIALEEAWSEEARDHVFLYVHVPFCAFRCAFCNLFTSRSGTRERVAHFLDALSRQVNAVSDAIGDARIARAAIGGGTPTHLSADELERLFSILDRARWGLGEVGAGIETSPETATAERLSLLRGRGIERISIGIQSFEPETRARLGRPQQPGEAERALDEIRRSGPPRLNIDLVYGADNQGVKSFLGDIERALHWSPEEIYLYPLYVRPGTGLGRRQGMAGSALHPVQSPPEGPVDRRLELYRAGRDLLLAAGYKQRSMRMFELPKRGESMPNLPYRCQEDAMIGLGCGARSYSRSLHYSDDWGVSTGAVDEILSAYLARDENAFSTITHGYVLDEEEQSRRYILQSLLQVAGLSLADYRTRFGHDAIERLPALSELKQAGLAGEAQEVLSLTQEGLAWSDAIGPWLYSERVRERMSTYEVR